jgi:superfamily II DNA helicase RecQ
MKPRS